MRSVLVLVLCSSTKRCDLLPLTPTLTNSKARSHNMYDTKAVPISKSLRYEGIEMLIGDFLSLLEEDIDKPRYKFVLGM